VVEQLWFVVAMLKVVVLARGIGQLPFTILLILAGFLYAVLQGSDRDPVGRARSAHRVGSRRAGRARDSGHSAMSVGRRAGMSPRLIVLIEGEVLLNDATALTTYQVAAQVAASSRCLRGCMPAWARSRVSGWADVSSSR
jgi:hypothetical protein